MTMAIRKMVIKKMIMTIMDIRKKMIMTIMAIRKMVIKKTIMTIMQKKKTDMTIMTIMMDMKVITMVNLIHTFG